MARSSDKTLNIIIAGDASGARKALKQVEVDADKMGDKLKDFGSKMTRNVSLPLIAAGAVSLKMGIDFEQSFTRMQALAGVSADEVDGLRDSVQDLASETGRGPQELAEALYFVRSSGIEGAAAMQTLEVAAKGAAIGLGTTQVVADAITSALNAYGTANLSAARAADVLAATSKISKREADELAPAFGRVLPIAAELGVGFEEVGAGIGFLTKEGNNAEEAATQLSGALVAMLAPTAEAKTVLDEVGISTAQLRDVLAKDGLVAALQLLNDKLGGNTEKMSKVFGDNRALRGVLALLKNDGKEAAAAFDEVGQAAGNVDKAFENFSETDAAAAQRALADLQNAAIQAGSDLAPVMASIASGIGDVAGAFATLPDPAQKAILTLAGIAIAIGPISTVAGNVVNLKGQIASLVTKIRAGEGAMAGFATKVLALPTPAIAAAVGVGILTAAFLDSRQQAAEAQAAIDDLVRAAAAAGDKDPVKEFAKGWAEVWAGIGDHGRETETAVKILRELGFSVDEVQKALFGSAEQWRVFADAVETAAHEQLGISNGSEAVITGLQGQRNTALGASRDLRTLRDAQSELGVETKGTADATDDLTGAQAESTEAAREQAEAYIAAQQALDALNNAVLGAFDAEAGYEQALRSTRIALDELTLARQLAADRPQDAEAQRELNDAYVAAEDAIRKQADALVELRVKQAEANGTFVTAEQKNKLYREELFKLAGQLAPDDPLRARIAALINQLGEVADDHVGRVDLDTSAAVGKLAALQAMFNNTLPSVPSIGAAPPGAINAEREGGGRGLVAAKAPSAQPRVVRIEFHQNIYGSDIQTKREMERQGRKWLDEAGLKVSGG